MAVLMWILQYALTYDLESLRKIINKKFPKLNPKDLNIPEAELLTLLASLRIISRNYTAQLESPDDLVCSIIFFNRQSKSSGLSN